MHCQACKESNLGHVDIDVEGERRQEQLYVPNWFSCDIKTGVRTLYVHVCPCTCTCTCACACTCTVNYCLYKLLHMYMCTIGACTCTYM